MIKYTAQNQLTLELFKHPFETELDRKNRWVILAELIPWDDLANVYCSKLDATSGRKSVDVRTVIAALIIKHKLRLDDRGTIDMISENLYMQYFCGLKAFATGAVFDASLFVDIRKRMGGEEFDAFNKIVIDASENLKPHQSRIKRKGGDNNQNKGTLKVDATVADQEISYPTDLKLLNGCRENLERIIDLLYNAKADATKPRTYKRVARKSYLDIAKKKNKTQKAIRKGVKQQLQFVSRDIKAVDGLLDKPAREARLKKRDRQILETIRQVYKQQKEMYDNKTHKCEKRIVNLYQPHVRPIVRGKDKARTESGSKINISEVNGFCRVDRFSWEAFNEGGDVKLQVENYKIQYGRYPLYFLGDGIYLTRENRKYLKSNGIKIVGKPLGRPPKTKESPSEKYYKKKKGAERNHVEGKFGQGKRGYGLNNIKARLEQTSESWVNAIFFVMNLTKLMQVALKYKTSFCLVLKIAHKSILETMSLRISIAQQYYVRNSTMSPG
ncbi:IS5 family transposase [Saccharicrinis sp. GN24d3]|uniref:IS5 family transposase n=1 Tax=Saccharicrinis sp. GN24d3 TaxID=3458416 RepID=UPI004036468F